MSARKDTPMHHYWHRRVEGQIKDAMNQHPGWFNYSTPRHKQTIINSLAKRIVGEIVAELQLATVDRSEGLTAVRNKEKVGVAESPASTGEEKVAVFNCFSFLKSLFGKGKRHAN